MVAVSSPLSWLPPLPPRWRSPATNRTAPPSPNSATQQSAAAAKTPNDAEAQYRAALANSYLAEVAIELRDRKAGAPGRRAGHEVRRKGRRPQTR